MMEENLCTPFPVYPFPSTVVTRYKNNTRSVYQTNHTLILIIIKVKDE